MARLTRLDGLRGIAACVVAAYHLQILFYGGLGDFYGGAVGWVFEWGWTFVDLFFVISGYIFAHVYIGGAGLQRGRPLADFAIARVARLYPLHLTMLLLVAVLEGARPENTVPNFLAHLFMLQGIVPGADEAFDGPSWSISVEMLCYALFALAACSGRKMLTAISAGLVVFVSVKLATSGLAGGPWSSDCFIRGVLGFFIGQLMWRYRDRLERVPTAVLALTFATGVAADVGSYSPLLPLTLLAWPSAVSLALRFRFFGTAPLLWLGDRSYAIYLIHYPVLRIFYGVLGKSPPQTMEVIAIYLAFSIVVFALSDLALRVVERPARKAVRNAWKAWHRPPDATARPTTG